MFRKICLSSVARTVVFLITFAGAVLVGSSWIFAGPLHSVVLSVPPYAEEGLQWCGPATGQMIMEGYPSGSCSIIQEDVMEAIEDHKVEAMWDTDPAGLAGAMNTLCPPPSGHWYVWTNADPAMLMHNIAYWMTRNDYPVAVLKNTTVHHPGTPTHEEHWVVISGIITDGDPTEGGIVGLEGVFIIDPAPVADELGGPATVEYLNGSDWYAEFQPVTKPASSYVGKYVAIIEPPFIRGRAVAPKVVVVGRVLPPEEVIKHAQRWMKKCPAFKYEPFGKLEKANFQQPLLVNKNYGGYYIVPLSMKKKSDYADAAILINAYNGKLKATGIFKPMKYMLEKQAINLAMKHLKLKKPKQVEAELIYPTREPVTSKYAPLWQIKANGKKVIIDQKGKFHRKFPFEREGCADFEDVGGHFTIGDLIHTAELDITILNFRPGAGTAVDVIRRGRAGGTGNELQVSLAQLDFELRGGCSELSVRVYDAGGEQYININGEWLYFDNYPDIHDSSLGGVHIEVFDAEQHKPGVLKLSDGRINSFKLGGEELIIDDVCWLP